MSFEVDGGSFGANYGCTDLILRRHEQSPTKRKCSVASHAHIYLEEMSWLHQLLVFPCFIWAYFTEWSKVWIMSVADMPIIILSYSWYSKFNVLVMLLIRIVLHSMCISIRIHGEWMFIWMLKISWSCALENMAKRITGSKQAIMWWQTHI